MKLQTKIITLATIIIMGTILTNALEPLTSTRVSIHGQLADSNTAYAGYSIYNQLLDFHWVAYILIGLAMFRKELFSKKSK